MPRVAQRVLTLFVTLAIVGLSLTDRDALAQSTWKGQGGNTNWSSPSNWNGSVPGADANVILATTTAINFLTIDDLLGLSLTSITLDTPAQTNNPTGWSIGANPITGNTTTGNLSVTIGSGYLMTVSAGLGTIPTPITTLTKSGAG